MGAIKAKQLEENDDGIDYKSMVVMAFYHDEIPHYTQGYVAHEMVDVFTADDATYLVERIELLRLIGKYKLQMQFFDKFVSFLYGDMVFITYFDAPEAFAESFAYRQVNEFVSQDAEMAFIDNLELFKKYIDNKE